MSARTAAVLYDSDGSIPADIVKEMADHAYEAVVAKTPKYVQRTLQAVNETDRTND